MEKLFVYDLETTGLNSDRNGIHQLSGMIIIDGIVKQSFDFRIRPFDADVIDQSALDIAGVTKEQIMDYQSAADGYQNLISMLKKYVNKFDSKDKFHLVGYNNRRFDDQFFRSFFEKSGDKYFGSWFWSDSIDVLVLASYHLRSIRNLLPDFKLRSVASMMGLTIDEAKLHDAKYDIDLTYQIMKSIESKNNSK